MNNAASRLLKTVAASRFGISWSYDKLRQSSPIVCSHRWQSTERKKEKPFLDFPTLPTFYAKGENLAVIQEPSHFYDYLLRGIKRAKRRIFLATLYIGKDEKELIATLRSALKANPKLEVHIVLDYLRSTREAPKHPSSASLVAPLHAEFPDQVHISLYHTPALSGWLKTLVPRRYDEGWGLWHGKIYGFDDDVLVTGANLSNDYFTNRQDRYIAIQNTPSLADYLQELLWTFASLSFRLHGSSPATTSLDIRPQMIMPSYFTALEDPTTFTEQAKEALGQFMTSYSSSSTNQEKTRPEHDTIIQPFLQMGQFGITQETDNVIPAILQHAADHPTTRLDWTSGYFSVRKGCRESLLSSTGPVRIVCASPEANGFYQSAGFSKYIPPAYTYLERMFWNEVKKRGRQDGLQLLEWKRPGWTYHAKGIWLSPSGESPSGENPNLTLVGSSNYGYRSAVRDIEVNLAIQTTSPRLRKALSVEVDNILEHARDKVDDSIFARPDRKVGFINRFAARTISDML